MSHDTVYVDHRELRRFMREGFVAMGVPSDEADICADVLIESDLRGIKSHGIGRFKMYIDRMKDGIISPVCTMRIVSETENTAVVDGGDSLGHVVAKRAMQLAIDKAEKHHVGMVAVRNSTHFGICGYYPSMAVERDMVGLAFSNARPSVAPTFGVEPVLGTNPISFGAPSDEVYPFLLDIATSTTQRGKIEVYALEGSPTPKGLTIDIHGNQPTDSKALLKMFVDGTASLLPLGGAGEELGGHKGYGLGVMVEILCAAFCGGAFGKALSGFEDGRPAPHRLGHFFAAINIASFVPVGVFKAITGSIMREIRASAKAPGHDRIFIAGEKEFEMVERRKKEGVPIPRPLQEIMIQLKHELGLEGFPFPFFADDTATVQDVQRMGA
ncbi:MAG TPA: Ldh family oxidoreductase [Deltaproteobacteria bacterium]|nr:Ldh family oxidoreductase [Deltaproteobacteria bacterium]HOM30153.1 Ldh family oxidoreductase [Deltaproteobacteria bacterium]HPP80359.1 Ldh family oxidoreductase [Deltaproteobacteria bacterium]